MKTPLLVTVLLISVLWRTPSRSQTTWITKDGYWWGLTYEAFIKSQEYIAAKDTSALEQLMRTGLGGPLKPGLRVYATDTKSQRILGVTVPVAVRIRVVGQTIEVWTNVEAVKRE